MTGHHHGRTRGSFVENTIAGLHTALDRAMSAENTAAQRGLLQLLDPRVKLGGLTALIVASAMAARLWLVAGVFILAVLLAAASYISIRSLASQVWIATLTFSGALALPALFLTPGISMYHVPGLQWDITRQGLHSAAYLILRAETAATLVALLVFTTPWAHILKALRMFRVPVVFVVILGMACRYILLLLQTAHEMFESRKSRTVGKLTRGDHRNMAIQSTAALLSRTLQLSGEVFLAMQSRGFRGEVYILDDFAMKRVDWAASLTFGFLTASLFWAGR